MLQKGRNIKYKFKISFDNFPRTLFVIILEGFEGSNKIIFCFFNTMTFSKKTERELFLDIDIVNAMSVSLNVCLINCCHIDYCYS